MQFFTGAVRPAIASSLFGMFIDGDAQMKRYIQGEDRSRVSLLSECLDDHITED